MPLPRNVSVYRTEEQETKGFPSSLPAILQIFWPCRDNKCGWVDPVVWCGLTGTQTWPEFGRFLTYWALLSPFPCQLSLRIKKGPSGHPGQHFGSGNAPRAVTCCKSWLTVINSSTQLALGSLLHLGEAILHLRHLQSFGGFGDMNHLPRTPQLSLCIITEILLRTCRAGRVRHGGAAAAQGTQLIHKIHSLKPFHKNIPEVAWEVTTMELGAGITAWMVHTWTQGLNSPRPWQSEVPLAGMHNKILCKTQPRSSVSKIKLFIFKRRQQTSGRNGQGRDTSWERTKPKQTKFTTETMKRPNKPWLRNHRKWPQGWTRSSFPFIHRKI